MSRRAVGFTLIEIMIVVAIIAVIAAIALPGYQNQIRDSRRADCAAVLTQGRQMMERYYSRQFTYAGAAAGTDTPAKCPIDGNDQSYRLALSNLSATGYTLTATPQNAQAADECGALSINQAGVKTVGGSTIDKCW